MLNKIVNGIEVQCTPEEEQAIRDEWDANETNRIEAVGTPSLEELIAKKLAEIQ